MIAGLHLKKHKDTLSPAAKRSLKYIALLGSPVPRENVEAIVARCCSPISLDYEFDED
jgi:hypothetical protein